MQQTVGRVMVFQSRQQLRGQTTLVRAHRIGIPFGAITIIDRNKGRLATLGETHIMQIKIAIDLPAQRFNRRPLRFGVRLGNPRRLPHPLDLHRVLECDFAFIHRTGNGCRRRRLRRTGQRYMPLARHQTRGRIKADPASSGQIDLAPRM